MKDLQVETALKEVEGVDLQRSLIKLILYTSSSLRKLQTQRALFRELMDLLLQQRSSPKLDQRPQLNRSISRNITTVNLLNQFNQIRHTCRPLKLQYDQSTMEEDRRRHLTESNK